jgi:polyhydroxyalkanoate synthesis regulator phasin
MKGRITMLARSSVNARLSALEVYVDMPKETTGMTITGRLDAQHSLLLAMRADMSDFRADLTELRTDVTELRTDVNDLKERVTRLEDGMGKALWGITEIKNLLAPKDGPL